MKIGDRCFVHGYVDEIRKDTVIIKNKGGYFGTDPSEVITVYDTTHPNWISCSERPPDRDGRYLITGKTGSVYSLDYTDGRWYGGISPIAWMILPEAYKEERK